MVRFLEPRQRRSNAHLEASATNGKHQIAPPTCILSIILTEVSVHGFSECSRRHPLSDLHFLFVHFGFDLLGLMLFLLTFDLQLKIIFIMTCFIFFTKNFICTDEGTVMLRLC